MVRLGAFCSGSLISPSVVITAGKKTKGNFLNRKIAHCVYKDSNPRHWEVTAGHSASSRFHASDEIGFQERKVVKILFDKPDFDGKTLKDDLALLILDKPFDITK